MGDTCHGEGHTGAESAGVFTAGRRSSVVLAAGVGAGHEKKTDANRHPACSQGAGYVFNQFHAQPRPASWRSSAARLGCMS